MAATRGVPVGDPTRWQTMTNAHRHRLRPKNDFVPGMEQTIWLLAAWMGSGGADPAVVGTIWAQESSLTLGNPVSPNYKRRDGRLVSASRDYGPLQLNDYWKLNQTDWNTKYNPAGWDLKSDPWYSFLAGARDVADHGGRSGDVTAAAKYWHGPKSRDIDKYIEGINKKWTQLSSFFDCLKGE